MHRKSIYVLGDVHTNTIENFWSQFKRSLDGTHNAVSAKNTYSVTLTNSCYVTTLFILIFQIQFVLHFIFSAFQFK